MHSAKDMPTALPDGLEIGAFTEREDVRDAFVGRRGDASGDPGATAPTIAALADLPRGALVGSSSLRRRSQLLALRPDLELVDVRGNVQTRLRKVEEQGLAGTVLAMAGLRRLGSEDVVSFAFACDEMVPAVGQGALAIEVRYGDERVAALIAALDHAPTATAVRAERALMRRLEGGCQVPIAAHGRLTAAGAGEPGEVLRLAGFAGSLDGSHTVRDEVTGAPARAEELGEALAERLLAAGGDRILAEVRGAG